MDKVVWNSKAGYVREVCDNPTCNANWHIFDRITEPDEKMDTALITDTCKVCRLVKTMRRKIVFG